MTTSTTPNTIPTLIPAIVPVDCLDLMLLLGLALVLVLVPVAYAALMFAKSRPAIVGNAALGLIVQDELIDVGQEGVEKVDGGWVFAVTADHWLFKAL